jgi:hypothetical protein
VTKPLVRVSAFPPNFWERDEYGKLPSASLWHACGIKGAIIVIRTVEIKGLRGICEGKLTDLSPLVVLVGPNGSGKSTVIEGVLIAASPLPTEAVLKPAEVVRAGCFGRPANRGRLR